MIRLFAAAVLLLAVAAPAFACEWNSAAGNGSDASQSASASHRTNPQTRS
jgi:predicted small secreted protein